MSDPKGLHQALEHQSGACRALAIALSDFADNGVLLAPERKILQGFAAQFHGVAEGLVEALALRNPSRLQRLWVFGGAAIMGLGSAAITGVAEGLAGELVDEAPLHVVACIVEVHERFSADLDELGLRDLEANLMDLPPAPQASDSGYLGAEGVPTPTSHYEAKDPTIRDSDRDSATGPPSDQVVKIGVAEEIDEAQPITPTTGSSSDS